MAEGGTAENLLGDKFELHFSRLPARAGWANAGSSPAGRSPGCFPVPCVLPRFTQLLREIHLPVYNIVLLV